MSLAAARAAKSGADASSAGVGTVAAGFASGVAACSEGVAAPLVSAGLEQAAKAMTEAATISD